MVPFWSKKNKFYFNRQVLTELTVGENSAATELLNDSMKPSE